MINFENTKNDRRERVFQMLFSLDFYTEEPAEKIFESFFEDGDNVPTSGYLRDTFVGAAEFIKEADVMIASHAKNWSTSRMSGVTRNLLRLAIYELLKTETPPKVVINEALELSKKFGEDQEPVFINGILNSIAKEAEKL
ncbi:MAG: transcription antitermination factor NusB [Clostridia bacterium]|nr:transcription antitermination factor NusB [Clostridia bacterium]